MAYPQRGYTYYVNQSMLWLVTTDIVHHLGLILGTLPSDSISFNIMALVTHLG